MSCRRATLYSRSLKSRSTGTSRAWDVPSFRTFKCGVCVKGQEDIRSET